MVLGSLHGSGARHMVENTLANAILNVMDQPSLLVHDTGVILAANQPWRTLFALARDSSTLPTVSEWLSGIDGGDKLLLALESMQTVDESFELRIPDAQRSSEVRYATRLTRLATRDKTLSEAIILLSEIDDHSSGGEVDRQMVEQINHLLVRQTVIEERERRRLGREVHDHVTQLLVHIRRQLADVRDGRTSLLPTKMISDVDQVIRVLQELTSSFSPPVLEDLGLLPAMHWLAEHLESSAGATVRCEDDGIEPRISTDVRTVAFRALRELTTNSIKHAPGAAIPLSLSVQKDHCLLCVHDDGPGFDCDEVQNRAQPYKGYGLLSIEQQIRAVGGKLEMRSAPGDGTQASITIPLDAQEPIKGDTHVA